jgi:hypothetical protein
MTSQSGPRKARLFSVSTLLLYEVLDHHTHDNSGPTCSLVGRPLVLVLGIDDGNDEVAKSHANCTQGESGLASNIVDVQDSRDGRNQHHNTNDTSCQERCRVIAEA